jgi:hypothetical protein
VATAHELERTGALVQLRARAAQRAGVGRIEIATGGGLGLLQVAAQRLAGVLERALELAVHPGQGTEVVGRHRVEVDRAGVLGVPHGVATCSGGCFSRS